MTLSAAILNETGFRKCYDILNASTLELTKFTNTKVEGTIECDRDGLLYTSIPQNGNWYAKVDGEEAEVLTIGQAMCAVLLTEGEHEVQFYYHNAAFALGWKISLVCAAVFALLAWCNLRASTKRGKYEKNKKEKH